MEAESKQARSHSIWSASPRRFKSTRCRRSQSPASCHSRNRRQHVTPEPQPISWGKISQGMPLFSTKMMPVRAARSSTRGLPPCGLGDSGGSSSSITSHSSSLTNSLAIFPTYPDPVVLKGSLSPGLSCNSVVLLLFETPQVPDEHPQADRENDAKDYRYPNRCGYPVEYLEHNHGHDSQHK